MKNDFVVTITRLSKGNPGALSVLMQIMRCEDEQKAFQAFEKIEHNQIMGPELWLLYKDENGQDIEKTINDLTSDIALSKLQKNRYSKFFIGE